MIMGAFSFGFFVFGGFTMIISFGNTEKIKTVVAELISKETIEKAEFEKLMS